MLFRSLFIIFIIVFKVNGLCVLKTNLSKLIIIDAGVSAITSPSTAGCYNTTQSVVVTIQNFGTTVISNIPVNVYVTGPLNQTISSSYVPAIGVGASASFTVKPFEPPTISCAVNPTTIKPGDSATVTSTGMSPQNRPLSYSYTTTGGTISGSGTTAAYASAGAPTGAIGITCNVVDDKSHTATASTSLTIVAPPPPPPPPHTSALCSISFATDKKRPTRVNNESKACLDEVALDLQRQADAKVVIVGESNAKENDLTAKQQKVAAKHKRAKVTLFAAQRAVNAKDYLITEKGIDASRVSTATGTTDGQSAENYLVPAGATFASDIQGTTPVEESTVKVEARKALGHK